MSENRNSTSAIDLVNRLLCCRISANCFHRIGFTADSNDVENARDNVLAVEIVLGSGKDQHSVVRRDAIFAPLAINPVICKRKKIITLAAVEILRCLRSQLPVRTRRVCVKITFVPFISVFVNIHILIPCLSSLYYTTFFRHRQVFECE